MLMRVFAVYDSKALAYMQPFFSNSNGAAIRAFADVIEEKNSPISKRPGDYQLYEIGSFDDQEGLLSDVSPIKLLCNGLDFVKVSMPSIPAQEVLSNGQKA